MLKINISNNFLNEKKYIISVIFDEFLGLEYKLNIFNSSQKIYDITLPNNKKLLFEDSFWSKVNDSYLKEEYIPKSVKFVKNDFILEQDIPVIFGSDRLEISENQIYSGIDIFASSFFMLTRWEEYVNKTRDQHNRFPATASLAYKNGFLHRPIVNEYVEMLWNMLKNLGYQNNRKHHDFEMLLSHDVDFPFKYTNLYSGIRDIGRDLLKKYDIKLATKGLLSKIKSHLNSRYDPNNTFDFLMNQSEELDLKSYFFFMGGGLTKFEENYNLQSKKIQSLIKEIKSRGHFIGFHPSYEAYNNKEIWKKEKINLENAIGQEVFYGREHYLRFETPLTWQIWEDNNMLWDSTLNYADHEGFRCGTCWEYPVFNFITKQQLHLKEKPLIVMEGNFFTYQKKLGLDSIKSKIIALINKCKKYNGIFVYLWHNSNFITKGNKQLYIDTIKNK